MKRILAIVLSLLVVMMTAYGCGSEDKSLPKDKDKDNAVQNDIKPDTESQTEPATEAAATAAAEQETKPSTESQTEPATDAVTKAVSDPKKQSETEPSLENESEMESDNGYICTNRKAGFSLTVPPGWILNDTDDPKADFTAHDEMELTTIYFTHMDTAAYGIDDESFEETYCDLFAEMYSEVYKEAGYKTEIEDCTEVMVGSKRYHCGLLTIHAEDDIIIKFHHLYRQLDDSLMIIDITTIPDYSLSFDEVLTYFSDAEPEAEPVQNNGNTDPGASESSAISLKVPESWTFVDMENEQGVLTAYDEMQLASIQIRNISLSDDDIDTPIEIYCAIFGKIYAEECRSDGLDFKIEECSEITIGTNSYHCGLVTVVISDDVTMEYHHLYRRIGNSLMVININTLPGITVSFDETLTYLSDFDPADI